MRLVYLILAHRDPELVHVLVETLRRHRSAAIYLHIDRRVDAAPFVSGIAGSDLRLVRPRVSANWGSYGLVRATLNGLTLVTREEQGPYHLVLLSGQDFPIKPPKSIEDKIASGGRWSAFLDPAPMGTPEGKERMRYERYFLHNQFNVRGAFRLQSILNRMLKDRRFPPNLIPYGGSQWWSADHEVIRYVVDYAKRHSRYRRFFWFSNIPDEMFFHTIIMNSRFADRVCGDNLRYIEWPEGSWSPRELTKADIPELLSSPALFARKFKDVAVTRELGRRLEVGETG